MKAIYSLIIFALLKLDSAIAQTTTTFKIDAAGEDAAIDDFVPGRPNPNEIEYNTCAWTIGGTPVLWRNLFKFDLSCIPPNATIQNADLTLFYAPTNTYYNALHSSLTSSNESVLQLVTSDWKEDSVNWNNQPTTSSINQVILPQSISGTQDYTNINVIALVQYMVNNPNANFGFLLKLINETYYSRLIFASGDYPDSSKHPILIVKYTIPSNDCITFRLDENGEDGAIDDYVPARSNPNEIEYNTCAWTINGTPVTWRNYFKFNLPCDLSSAFIQSANLSLYHATQNTYTNAEHSSLSNSNESVLQRVTAPWTENTVNWINQPASTTVNQVIIPQSISGTQDYTNIDVTDIVRIMQSNTNQNYGFLLKLINEVHYARLIFASGDYPDQNKHPLLEVCYSISTTVNDTKKEDIVSVYPNPFLNEIHVSINRNISNSSFNLYNSIGQIVFSKTKLAGEEFLFKTNNLSNGIYFYKLIENGTLVTSGKLQAVGF